MESDQNDFYSTDTFVQPYQTFARGSSVNGSGSLSFKRKGSTVRPPFLAQANPKLGAFPIASSLAADGGTKKRKTLDTRPACTKITRSMLEMGIQNENTHYEAESMYFKSTSILSVNPQTQTSEGESELVKEVGRNIEKLRKEYNLWTEEAESEADLLQMIAENPQNATLSSFVPLFEALKSILELANVDNPGNNRVVDGNGFNTDQQLRFLARQPVDVDMLFRGNPCDTS